MLIHLLYTEQNSCFLRLCKNKSPDLSTWWEYISLISLVLWIHIGFENLFHLRTQFWQKNTISSLVLKGPHLVFMCLYSPLPATNLQWHCWGPVNPTGSFDWTKSQIIVPSTTSNPLPERPDGLTFWINREGWGLHGNGSRGQGVAGQVGVGSSFLLMDEYLIRWNYNCTKLIQKNNSVSGIYSY